MTTSTPQRNVPKPTADDDHETNMTPMIDVVFLLIIFFLCIDFRILESKLPAYLPKDVGSSSHQAEPQETLRLKIHLQARGTQQPRPDPNETRTLRPWEDTPPYRLQGHRVTYSLGPNRLATLDAVRKRLQTIHATHWTQDPQTGQRKPIPVVVEPGPGTVYGDVAPLADQVIGAGFSDIRFGGGLGRRQAPTSPGSRSK